jgi:tRNA dimethylallyltransferase
MKKLGNLVVLAGPTAVGKTEVAVRLAGALDCEIISADSRQFYRELNIGTARPGPGEMGSIPHHFVGFLGLEEEFSAGRFGEAVMHLLPSLFERNGTALMVGGSGLYIQAVCQGMNDMPVVPRHYRDQLYRELYDSGLGVLSEELQRLDPDYAAGVDLKNPQRVIRALEVCRATGIAYSSYRDDRSRERPFHAIQVGLTMEREELFRRIDQRIDRMVALGLIEEVRSLMDRRHLNALRTLGYTEVFNYLDGRQDWAETLRLLKRNTHRYARRQLTWFRREPSMAWFHPDQYAEILAHIRTEIQKQPVHESYNN